MKKIIVFGGSGFLGSYVVDELIRRNCEVINADLVPPKYNTSKQVYKKCDICNIDDLVKAIDTESDAVYNFAGLTDIDISNEKPDDTVKLNILGNVNILEMVRSKGIKRYIYASSVYAFSKKGSFYGISKQTSERIIEEYYERYGLKYTILRYGSLYGERADEHNGIYRYLKQALLENKIIHRGNGEEVREFIHARDAALLSVDILDEKYANRHLILTGIEKLRIRDLLVMIKEICNDQIEIEFDNKDFRGHYNVTPYSFHPTIGEKLVNNPYVDLGQGLLESISEMHRLINKIDEDAID